jgi:hypothetical protein
MFSNGRLRLRTTLNSIKARLWWARSSERRVPLREISRDSLDGPEADAKLRICCATGGKARREVDNAKCGRPPRAVAVEVHRMKENVGSAVGPDRGAAITFKNKYLRLASS